MASMNRNLNLEEVNSDAFMGIPFLNHQTIIQKVLFVGSIVCSVAVFIVGIFVFNINPNILIVVSLVPLAFGVAFGCNYNQDLSLIKYLRLILFKSSVKLVTKPTEDIEQIKNSADRIRQEEELKRNQERQTSPEEQKKLLIKMLAGVLLAVGILVTFLILASTMKTEEVHHNVDVVETTME